MIKIWEGQIALGIILAEEAENGRELYWVSWMKCHQILRMIVNSKIVWKSNEDVWGTFGNMINMEVLRMKQRWKEICFLELTFVGKIKWKNQEQLKKGINVTENEGKRFI